MGRRQAAVRLPAAADLIRVMEWAAWVRVGDPGCRDTDIGGGDTEAVAFGCRHGSSTTAMSCQVPVIEAVVCRCFWATMPRPFARSRTC